MLLALVTDMFAVESGVYIELGAGSGTKKQLNTKDGDYIAQSSYVGSVYLGYQADIFRIEFEDSYKSDTLKSYKGDSIDGDFTQNTQMFNLYYSGYNESKFITTLGVGAGISSIEVQDIKDSNIFSYQAMFSIGYMKTKDIIITPKYSYTRTSKSDHFERNSDQILSLNIRYLF